MNLDTTLIQDFYLSNLQPLHYYYMRFKYNDGTDVVYTYDVKSKEYGAVYKFETIATIGIENVAVKYTAENYSKKFLDISYKIDRDKSILFEKIKYVFYNTDGQKINLTNDNIVRSDTSNTYRIENGALIVTNSRYGTENKFENISERINIAGINNVFTMGDSYMLQIVPTLTTTDGTELEIEKVTHEFDLNALREPAISLKMVRYKRNNVNGIRAQVTIKDTDGMIYGRTEYGEYTLKIYRYKDDINSAQELNIYSSIGGTNVKGATFNINQNANNYTVYLQSSDVDYTYNYLAELKCKYDRENKGLAYCNENKTEKTLKAISNSDEISIGTVAVDQKDGQVSMRFYDSYSNINQIDKIEYSVFDISNNYDQSNYFKPEWTLVNDDVAGISYYKIETPIYLENKGVYTIQMNIYAGDTLVDQVNTTYIYE